jgi:hypothetical protein
VRVSLKNIPGINNVDVSLNNGSATADLKANNTTSIREILEAITKNGFATKQTKLTANGSLSRVGNQWKFRITGSNEELAVEAAPNVLLKEGVYMVEGVVPEVQKGKQPTIIQLTSIKAVSSN